MAGISTGVGISPTDGINSGATGINSGAGGLVGGSGGAAPPAAPTFYQRMIPGAVVLGADGAGQFVAQIPGSVVANGR